VKQKIIIIVGPTATGKTKLSIELCKYFNGEVVSGDSMQIYKHMTIGTAKPSKEEMQGIKHHLIDIVEPWDCFDVAKFKEHAQKAVKEISVSGKLPFLVGGTGLYINSFIDNVNLGSYKADYEYRAFLEERAKNEGGAVLLEELREVDPVVASRLHENDVKRIIRGLEIYKVTGVSQSEHNEKSRLEESPYEPLIIGLNYADRQKLYERINLRVDIMLENGLLQEVKELFEMDLPEKSTAIQAIGYKELRDYLENGIGLEEAVDKIKQESRRYAKRQLTWFKKDTRINWINIDEFKDFDQIFSHCKNMVESFINI